MTVTLTSSTVRIRLTVAHHGDCEVVASHLAHVVEAEAERLGLRPCDLIYRAEVDTEGDELSALLPALPGVDYEFSTAEVVAPAPERKGPLARLRRCLRGAR